MREAHAAMMTTMVIELLTGRCSGTTRGGVGSTTPTPQKLTGSADVHEVLLLSYPLLCVLAECYSTVLSGIIFLETGWEWIFCVELEIEMSLGSVHLSGDRAE